MTEPKQPAADRPSVRSRNPDVVRSRNPNVVRDRILDAAQAEFMAAGFAAASTNRILERFAGSKPTMFRHYSTKRAMFAGVVMRIAARWRTAIDPAAIAETTPAAWLTAFGVAALTWILAEDNIFVGRMAVAEGHGFPEVADLYRQEAVEPIEAALAGKLAQWHEAGLIVTLDARRDAVAFLDLTLSGQVARRLYGGPAPTRDEIAAHVAWCVALFIEGRARR